MTDVQERLRVIWSAVLGRPDVDPADNFFDLGGDSMSMIEVVALAGQRGLHFSPLEMISHQTIAELAPTVGTEGPGEAELVVTGAVVDTVLPLTPTQLAFLRHQPNPHHFNQSALWHGRGLRAEPLRRAVAAVVAHHDAFRVRLTPDLHQHLAADAGSPVVLEVSADDVHEVSARLHRSVDVHDGPLLAVALVDLGGRGQRLLVVAHHLVVDGVSWRVLRADLDSAYRQAAAGSPPVLPPVATPMWSWAARLDAPGYDLRLWTDRARRTTALPWTGRRRDEPSPDRVGEATTTTVRLGREATRRLLDGVRRRGGRVDALLLGAAAVAVGQANGLPAVGVDVEHHGRTTALGPVDLSRTLGWCTEFHPVVVTADAGLDAAVASADAQLTETADTGLWFGLLTRENAELAGSVLPPVLFNYHGRSSTPPESDGDGILGEAAESLAPDRDPDNRLSHPVEITAVVQDDVLVTVVTCAASAPAVSSPRRLAELYLRALAGVG